MLLDNGYGNLLITLLQEGISGEVGDPLKAIYDLMALSIITCKIITCNIFLALTCSIFLSFYIIVGKTRRRIFYNILSDLFLCLLDFTVNETSNQTSKV